MPIYTYTTIDDPSATGSTFATGINDAGQIVGVYDQFGLPAVVVGSPLPTAPTASS
jgi:hypothetical protein